MLCKSERSGLPGWTYFSERLFELECAELFRTHWQYICHVSEVAEPGRFATLDIGGERGFVIRGEDGALRGFHNLCRHRGSRVVAAERGVCKRMIVCPFHGWTYNLDGSLRGVSRPETFPRMSKRHWGLKPLDMEVWNGLVFLRFCPGPQPSVAEMMAPFEAEVAPYDIAGMVSANSDYSETICANWKAVRDVDNEGYHVPQAHPALHDLYGQHYFDEPYRDYVSRSAGHFNESEGRHWSVLHYRRILPCPERLPESHRQLWLYLGLFPNFVLGLYPDSVIHYRELPLSAVSTVQTGGVFRYRNESRELRLARYLSGRIDRETSEEDRMLNVWAAEATRSSAFEGIILSDLEAGIRSHHDHLREVLPVLNLDAEPTGMSIAEANRAARKEISAG